MSSFWSQINTNLDAAVPLLGPDTVLVVHPLDLGEAGVVVALQGPGKAGEVLEAAHLGRHVLVITTELRHLASKLSNYCQFSHFVCHLDLPLVAGAVPHGEADGPGVRLRGTQVNVGFKEKIKHFEELRKQDQNDQ